MRAPIGRKASVTVMLRAIAVSVVPKSRAIAVRAKTTRKKSNASRVQPRKAARTAARCSPPALAGRPRATSVFDALGGQVTERLPMITHSTVTGLLQCLDSAALYWPPHHVALFATG